MTRKKNTRMANRRRAADPLSWAYAIAGNWDMDGGHATKIENHVRLAYQLLREGHGTADQFDTVACALNVAMVRAEKIGQPVVDAIKAGAFALVECDRGDGRFTFTGPGILAMNAAVDLYADLLRESTPRQMQEASDEVARRARVQQGAAA